MISKAQSTDTLICDVPDRDSVEFENLPWVGNNDFLEHFLDSIGYPNSQQRIIGPDQVRFHVPIKFWIYRNSAGVGGPDVRDLRNYIDNLNRLYNVDNHTLIGFYMRCDIGYIDDDNHVDVGTDLEAWDLIHNHKEQGCINIHIANTIADDALGVSYRARFFGVDGIFLSARTYTDPNMASTIAHEVGHYFELDHTHQYFDKGNCRQEPVDRNRTWPFFNLCFRKTVGARMCEATGDGLRDTPADPELNQNSSCVFNASGNYTSRTDNWGDHYAAPPAGSSVPDTRNIMSYNGTRSCRDVFSRLQIGVMLYSIYYGKSSGNFSAWKDAQGEYDEYEMDNFSQVARPITLGEIQERNFNKEYRGSGVWSQCDIDWVRFTPTCSGTFTVETSAMSGRTNANTRLTLFDNGLTQLAQNDDISSSNQFSSISYNFTAGNTYFIRVENMSNGITGYYQLTVKYAPTINGDNNFCTVSNNYTISSLPAGATVQWQATPQGIVIINSPNSSQTTLTKSIDGAVNLIATISNACGQTVTVTKQNISVGAPLVNFSVEPFDPNQQFCTNSFGNTIKVEPQPIAGVTGFQWGYSSSQNHIPPTIYKNHGTYDQDFIFSRAGQYQIYARAENECGLGTTQTLDVYFSSCFGGGLNSFNVAPNPTTGDLQVLSTDEKTSIQEIRISDKRGKIIKHFFYKGKNRSVNISLSSLPADIYYVQIFNGTEWISKPVIKN